MLRVAHPILIEVKLNALLSFAPEAFGRLLTVHDQRSLVNHYALGVLVVVSFRFIFELHLAYIDFLLGFLSVQEPSLHILVEFVNICQLLDIIAFQRFTQLEGFLADLILSLFAARFCLPKRRLRRRTKNL